jgi:hypothetical protein
MRKILSAVVIVSLLTVMSAAAVLANHIYPAPENGFNHPNFEAQWLGDEWAAGPAYEPAAQVVTESYQEAPGGERIVQYFDKARFEDNSYRAQGVWAVTNGLLVTEMVTGAMQMGDGSFIGCSPSTVHVAGDPGQEHPFTYANMKEDFAPYKYEWDPVFSASDKVHQVGLVMSPVYKLEVPVNGTLTEVWVQAGQRQTLTYTASNPAGFQVEFGNAGQHYYEWRYNGGCNPPSVDERPDEPTTDATAFSVEDCSPFVMLGGHEVCFAPLGGSVAVSGNTVTFTQGGLAGEVALAMVVRTHSDGVNTVQVDLNRKGQVLFYDGSGPRVYCQEFNDCLTDGQGNLSLVVPTNGTFAVYIGTTGRAYEQFTLTFGGPASGPVLVATPYVWQE